MPRHLRILLLILLLGATSRIVNLDNFSLWVDEGLAWYHANSPDLALSLARDTHPPLYFAALRLWEFFAGESEIGLRMFSVLPSLLSIAMVYQLAKEFVRARGGDAKTSSAPTLAALMMALADAEIFMSQEVRHYTWHVLFAVCSMWAMLRWSSPPISVGANRDSPLQHPNRRTKYLLLWVMFTTALVYTHYIGAFTGIVEGLYALLFLRGRVRIQAVGALVVSALLLAPWLLLVGAQQADNNGVNWSFQSGWYMIENIRLNWFTQQWPLMLGLALLGLVTVVYTQDSGGRGMIHPALTGQVNGGSWSVQFRPFAPALLLLMWVIVPVALTFILNNFLPLLSTRRMTQITPAVALLFAFGLANFRQPARGFLTAVIVVYSVLYVDFSRYEPDWRVIARMTSDYAVPGDLVLTDVGGGDYQVLYYYDQYLPPAVTVRSLKVWRDFEPETYAQLGDLIRQYQSVWLLYWSDDGQVFGWLSQFGFVRTTAQTLDHLGSTISVYRYDRMPDNPVAEYDNGMRLLNAKPGSGTLAVDLWWSVDTTLGTDYTTSVFLLDESGQLVAQSDSAPFNGARPTSGWAAGEVVYDPKRLQVVNGGELPPGTYQIGVQVYAWSPQGTVRSLTNDGADWAVVGALRVEG